MFSFNKDRKLFGKLEEYFATATETLVKFQSLVDYALEKGCDPHLELLVDDVARSEHNADEMRREIELEMFSQSLLPETREDLLEIIEGMDCVPNHCESAAYILADQRSAPIPAIKDDLAELVGVGMECFKHCVEAARECFGKNRRVEEFLRKVNDFEHLGDKLERKMIRTIFADPTLDPGAKLMQKEIVGEIGAICDKSKQAAGRIMITAIKRRI